MIYRLATYHENNPSASSVLSAWSRVGRSRVRRDARLSCPARKRDHVVFEVAKIRPPRPALDLPSTPYRGFLSGFPRSDPAAEPGVYPARGERSRTERSRRAVADALADQPRRASFASGLLPDLAPVRRSFTRLASLAKADARLRRVSWRNPRAASSSQRCHTEIVPPFPVSSASPREKVVPGACPERSRRVLFVFFVARSLPQSPSQRVQPHPPVRHLVRHSFGDGGSPARTRAKCCDGLASVEKMRTVAE
jgi:hypothetical protein